MTINSISAWLAVLSILLVARGFFHLISISRGDFLSNALVGVSLFGSSITLRMWYWDVLPHFLSDEQWFSVRDGLGVKDANALPNLLVVIGAYFLMRARFLLIPPADRNNGGWNVLTGVFYPAHKCIAVRMNPWRAKK